jgi:tetratricopeptide (TPR) repeat protein
MENNNDAVHVTKFEIPLIEKKLGDVKVSEKNYEEAINHYKNSIMALKILFDEESTLLEDEKKATELIEEVGIPVHLNMSLCYLQLEDWRNVVFYSNKVLELKPENLKAIYRRCWAYIKMKDLENASKDLEKLEKGLPDNSEELKKLKNCYEELEKENSALYKNIRKKFVSNSSNNIDSKFDDKENDKVFFFNLKNYKKLKCSDLIELIPKTGKKIINLGINLSIIIPYKIAMKTASTIKNIFWDFPFNITSKSINFFVIEPAKLVLNKVNLIKLKNNNNNV